MDCLAETEQASSLLFDYLTAEAGGATATNSKLSSSRSYAVHCLACSSIAHGKGKHTVASRHAAACFPAAKTSGGCRQAAAWQAALLGPKCQNF